MHITFRPDGYVEIDDARIIYRNFSGEAGKYNREGNRNFAVVIDKPEIADALAADVNKFGVGWNVRIKDPREEGDIPFMTLPVKVKFNGRGPHIYLIAGSAKPIKLDEGSVGCLDKIDIRSVKLDIRPYDDEVNGKPFRAAYLHSMEVIQEVDRFIDAYSQEEYPGEVPFN